MPGQSSDKVRVGQPLKIRAQTFNDIVESKDDYLRRRQISVPKEVRHFPISTDKLKVENATGANRRLGEVLEVDNVLLIDEVDPEHLWQSGVTPDTTRPFGILRKPVPHTTPKSIEELQVSGTCKALVNVTDLDHDYAQVECGNHVLQSATFGPVRILYKPGTTGEKECIVVINPFAPQIRVARTTTSATHPTYPTRPANKFVVEFGKVSFTETPGCEDPTFDPYSSSCGGTERPVAMDLDGKYWPEGSIVSVYTYENRHFILGAIVPEFAIGELDEDVCGEVGGEGSGSGEGAGGSIAVVNVKAIPTCDYFSPTMVKNTRGHSGPTGSKVLMIKSGCSEGSGSGSGTQGHCETGDVWDLVDMQLRRHCVLVAVVDRTSCLGSAAIFVADEWCPADEPTSMCVISDFGLCSGELPACDLTWVYNPDDCCNGGGSGSGSGP